MEENILFVLLGDVYRPLLLSHGESGLTVKLGWGVSLTMQGIFSLDVFYEDGLAN